MIASTMACVQAAYVAHVVLLCVVYDHEFIGVSTAINFGAPHQSRGGGRKGATIFPSINIEEFQYLSFDLFGLFN